MNTPEKLSLWDRIFNRYRKEVSNRGEETWSRVVTRDGFPIESSRREYLRNWVEYKVFDRVTGSITIEKDYLD